MIVKSSPSSGGRRRRALCVVLTAPLSAAPVPAVSGELAPAFKACTDAPSAGCVLGLAADAITSELAAGGDPLLAYAQRDQMSRLTRETVVGLGDTGAAERAVDLIRSTGRTAEERAALLLDSAQKTPALANSAATIPLLQDSLRTLDPFTHWPALASVPAAERSASLTRWLGIIRLCEEAGLHDQVLASVNSAQLALGTPAFDQLGEGTRTELAAAVVRAELAAHEPAMAEDASAGASGGTVWSALRVEIAAEYARQNRTTLALARTSHLFAAAKQPATIEIFKSFLRRKYLDLARSSLLQLDSIEQTRALVAAAGSVNADDLLAVLNVVSKPVQGIARAALVRRLLREGNHKRALELASGISEAWTRLDAVAAVVTRSALAGDATTVRDARYALGATRPTDVNAQEYFAAAFVTAFSRVAMGEFDSSKSDLDTLQSRLEAVRQSGMLLANPQGLDLLTLNLDAFRMTAGEEALVLAAMGSSTPGLFGQAFAAGTAFGMSGASAKAVVAHALEAISSVEDPNLRIALLVTLARQMQAHELVVAFGGGQ